MLAGRLCLQQPLKDHLGKTARSLLPGQGGDMRWQTPQVHVSLKGTFWIPLHWVASPTVRSTSLPQVRRLPCPVVRFTLGKGEALTS